jgi:microcystin degradation protein MlrC
MGMAVNSGYCVQGSKPLDAVKTKTIAIAELCQEENGFSPVLTTRREFEAGALLYGEEIIAYSKKEDQQIAGFLDAVAELGEEKIRIVPILKAKAMSGGPVESKLYAHFKRTILDALENIQHLDGIYLSLHGTMGVEGLEDPEGDLLAAVRKVVGKDIPIGVSYDLHANITEEDARHASFIVGYKTNPHRDHYDTGYRSGKILVETLQGEVKPVMAVNKMRLLKGGGMTIDFLSPMRSIFRRMKKMEKDEEVLCVSNFMVHLWTNQPQLGWSTVAVTDDNPALAQRLADEIADLNWSVRAVKHPEPNTPSEGIAIARNKWFRRKFGTVVFCDASDCVGAGAPGENTWILKALMEEAADLTSYLTIRDEEAATEAFQHEIGETITLTVGGKLDKVYNRSLDYTGELIFKDAGRLGKTVILRNQGIHLIISELADSLSSPSFFSDLGLSLWRADIVVVKNLFPFRYRYLLYNRKTVNIATPGTTSVDVFQLNYKNLPRPIYPLDDIDSWR